MGFGKHGVKWDIMNRSSGPTLGEDDSSLGLKRRLSHMSKTEDGLFAKRRINIDKVLLHDAMGDKHVDFDAPRGLKLLKKDQEGHAKASQAAGQT